MSGAVTERSRFTSDSRVCNMHNHGLELWLSGPFPRPCAFVNLEMPWCGSERRCGLGPAQPFLTLRCSLPRGYSEPLSVRTVRGADESGEWMDRAGGGGERGIPVKAALVG